jgi:DNA-binding MarR family transcriptional regulator
MKIQIYLPDEYLDFIGFLSIQEKPNILSNYRLIRALIEAEGYVSAGELETTTGEDKQIIYRKLQRLVKLELVERKEETRRLVSYRAKPQLSKIVHEYTSHILLPTFGEIRGALNSSLKWIERRLKKKLIEPAGTSDTLASLAWAGRFDYWHLFDHFLLKNARIIAWHTNNLLTIQRQQEDGGVPLREVETPFSDLRYESVVDSTASALNAYVFLDSYYYKKEDIRKKLGTQNVKNLKARLQRGIESCIQWLLDNRFEEGFWSIKRELNGKTLKNYPRVFATSAVLEALGWYMKEYSKAKNVEECRKVCTKAARWLVKKARNKDQGWGFEPQDNDSNSVCTAQAIYSILISEEEEKYEKEINDGIRWITRHLNEWEIEKTETIPLTTIYEKIGAVWNLPIYGLNMVLLSLLRSMEQMRNAQVLEKVVFGASLLSQKLQQGYLKEGKIESLSATSLGFEALATFTHKYARDVLVPIS